jgi:hypothetical protein
MVRPGRVVRVLEERRIVQHPRERELDDVGEFAVEAVEIRRVVVEVVRGVAEPVLGEHPQGVRAELRRRGAIADGLASRHARDDVASEQLEDPRHADLPAVGPLGSSRWDARGSWDSVRSTWSRRRYRS